MSASNWTTCPQCERELKESIIHYRDIVENQYGQITQEEYMKAIDFLNSPPELGETLREDYEVGILNGTFEVSYRASCRNCTFSYKEDIAQKV